MPELSVTYNGEKTKISYQIPTLLSDLLTDAGIFIEHPCAKRGICKKCTVLVDGKEELSCKFIAIGNHKVVVNNYVNTVVNDFGVAPITDNACLCLDIGTTTLALALVSLGDGKIIKTLNDTNPQSAFGADVMSRIQYCKDNGVLPLQNALIEKINTMIFSVLGEENLEKIEHLYVSGNTTMLHLFLGVDCSAMAASPFTPAFLEAKSIAAQEIGIVGAKNIVTLPNISAFVGADVVAGLNYIGDNLTEKYRLLVDLGTNAEIVLFNKNEYLCTTAAAGPCFEGVNISCGMTARRGAVATFNDDGSMYVLGNATATGICATGLIDIIAVLIKKGIIDASGYMQADFNVTDSVALSIRDVREFQLAKSAVYSAIMALIKTADTSFENIEGIYVSGGFSDKMNVENAALTGLLPKELISRFFAINNSALLGTVKFATEKNVLKEIINKSRFVDISSSEVFSTLFMENMSF